VKRQRRWLPTREQLQDFKKIPELEHAGAGRTLLQNRQNIGIKRSADALEEIPYTAAGGAELVFNSAALIGKEGTLGVDPPLAEAVLRIGANGQGFNS
jgi:hypothetical protein